jgi:hypothetical protein
MILSWGSNGANKQNHKVNYGAVEILLTSGQKYIGALSYAGQLAV